MPDTNRGPQQAAAPPRPASEGQGPIRSPARPREAAKQVAGQAQDAAKQVVGQAQDAAKPVIDQVKQGADQLAQQAKEHYGNAQRRGAEGVPAGGRGDRPEPGPGGAHRLRRRLRPRRGASARC